jgi:hypothetical protein
MTSNLVSQSWNFDAGSTDPWSLSGTHTPLLSDVHALTGGHSLELQYGGQNWACLFNYATFVESFEVNVYIVNSYTDFEMFLFYRDPITLTEHATGRLDFHRIGFGPQGIYADTNTDLHQDLIGTYTVAAWNNIKIVDNFNATCSFYVNGVFAGTFPYDYPTLASNSVCVESLGIEIEAPYVDNMTVTTPVYYTNVAGAISFDAVDPGSGVAGTHYRIAGTISVPWTLYTVPFVVSGADGLNMIYFNSIDADGNNETLRNSTVYLDTTAPVTTLSYTPVAPPNIVTTATVFTLNVVETGSGVNYTTYWYTGNNWTIYTVPFTLLHARAGNVVIEWHSIDNVGNNETVKNTTVYINIMNGIHVHATYYGLDGGNDLFQQMKTFVDGSRTVDPDFTFASSCLFNLTIRDPFNAVVYTRVLNTNVTGNYLDIILPMKWTWFINNHVFVIVLNITRGNITESYSLNEVGKTPSNMLELYLALGTYTCEEYYLNDTMITGVNESRIVTPRISDPRSFFIDFGWVKAPVGPIDQMSIFFSYVLFFIIIVAVGATIVGIIVVRRSPEKKKKREERSSESTGMSHYTRG